MDSLVLKCVDCGHDYIVSGNELVWLEKKNWDIPKRCVPCRKQKRLINKFGDKPTSSDTAGISVGEIK